MNPQEKYKANIKNSSSKEQKIIMIFNEIIKILAKSETIH